jgi:hypothetical protein
LALDGGAGDNLLARKGAAKMEQRSDRRPKLEPDELINQLLPDASQFPDVRVLVGLLGRSTRQGYWRLYFTLTLDEYVEFAETDVVHSHALNREESQLGGTVIWVRREANLQHIRTASREAQADFLQGAITNSLAQRVRRGVAGRRMAAFQPQHVQFGSVAVHVSCVREFCDFVVKSFLGGGDVYCEGSWECTPGSWQAECP